MKTFKRWLRWTVINSSMAALIWHAVHGSQGAANLVFFITWGFVALSLMYLLLVTGEAIGKGEPSFCRSVSDGYGIIPPIVDRLYDLMIGGFLIWNGWWFTGVGYTVSMFFQHFAIEMAREAVEKRKEPTV